MNSFLNMFLIITKIVSMIIFIVFVPFGIYEYIMGPEDLKKLLKKLNIPLTYNQFLIIGFICVAVFFASLLLHEKFFG